MERKFSSISPVAIRLIYLWAFVESGLGGLMHLFHIPLTGFVVGGFSVVINVLLAKYTKVEIRTMFLAIGITLLIKFSLSPQSPPGAYFAVAFQGISAIMIFFIFNLNRVSILFYSNFVMIENSIQKPLLAYLFLGDTMTKEIWNSILHFFPSHEHNEKIILLLAVLYFGIYILWAVLVGWLSIIISERLESYHLPKDFNLKLNVSPDSESSHSNAKIWKTTSILLLVIACLIMLYFHLIQLHSLLRIILILAFFGFFLPAMFRLILRHYQKKNKNLLSEVISNLPEIQSKFIQSYKYSKSFNGFRRWKEFVFLVIYLNIVHEHHE